MTHIRTWVGCPLAREAGSAGCVEIKQKLSVLGGVRGAYLEQNNRGH